MDSVSIGLAPALFILTTIAIGALMKGITGLGLPIFAIPALAMFVPVEDAVVVMALPGLVGNIWLVVVHRKHFPLMQKHYLFLTLGFIGALVGTWLLKTVDDRILKVMLTAWLGFYLIQHYSGKAKSGLISGKPGMAGPMGFVAGAFQGSVGISAALVAPYFHAHGLTLSAFAFAVAFAFAILAVAQLSAMTTVNLLTPTLLSYSLLATLVTIVFIPLGVKLAGKIQRESFDRLLPAIFILIELKLLYDVLV